MGAISVMVNGLPGNMGQQVAAEVVRRGWELVPFSLTGEAVDASHAVVEGVELELLKPSQRDRAIEGMLGRYPKAIAVDYTHPTAVVQNIEFYLHHKISFVMGTTGGDRDKIEALLADSPVAAVVAPNMAKQIVAFQAMMEWGAAQFPNLFKGWDLRVTESHQQGKADTSGTAKAVVGSLQQMGLAFDLDQIEMVRTPQEQLAMGVPASALAGHAYHTYAIDSTDGSVHFEFQHNVCGRQIYAAGSCDAVAFLEQKREAGALPRLYTMIDLLRAGAMD